MLRRICLVGIRGTGKTTLINKIRTRILWIDVLIGSNILKELVGNDFNNFDKYSQERKQYFRRAAIRYMEKLQMKTKKDLLIEGHTTLYNRELKEITPVFTDLDCHFYTDLIYYNVPAEIVLSRRKQDKSKRRELKLEIIEKELDAELEESKRISKIYNMGWYEIKEEEGQDISEVLFNLLKNLHNME